VPGDSKAVEGKGRRRCPQEATDMIISRILESTAVLSSPYTMHCVRLARVSYKSSSGVILILFLRSSAVVTPSPFINLPENVPSHI